MISPLRTLLFGAASALLFVAQPVLAGETPNVIFVLWNFVVMYVHCSMIIQVWAGVNAECQPRKSYCRRSLPPAPQHSSWVCPSTDFLATCSAKCNYGFEQRGAIRFRCSENRTWAPIKSIGHACEPFKSIPSRGTFSSVICVSEIVSNTFHRGKVWKLWLVWNHQVRM